MTNSRSRASRSRRWAALIVLCTVMGLAGAAQAGRKRVVVLDFEGPKGEKFHDELVKLIKKTHTVVPTDKWNGTAEELGAGELSDKNVKKVAKKLKVDAVVEGKIEKRRDEFIIRIKLHQGKTGELVGNPIGTKAEGPRIDGKAQRDLNDELIGAIDNVETNHGGAVVDDEDDAKPSKKLAKHDDEDDRPAKKAKKPDKDAEDEADDKPVKRGFSRRSDDERGSDKVAKASKAKAADDEDAAPAKKAKPAEDEDAPPVKKLAKKPAEDEDAPPAKKVAKKPADDEDAAPAKKAAKAKLADDEDDKPAKRVARRDEDEQPKKVKKVRKADDEGDDDAPRKAKKKVAARDDDDSVEAEAGPALSSSDALTPAERALDAVVGMSLVARRLSFTFRSGFRAPTPGYKGNPVGGAMLDATFYPLAFGHSRRDIYKNIGVNVMYDRVLKIDSKDAMGHVLDTKSSRWGIAGVFRYPISKDPNALVVGGTLGYSKQLFRISGTTEIPSVDYTIFEPGVLARLPVGKLVFGIDAKLMIISDTGQLQDQAHYGTTKLIGYEGEASADYMITRNIFARAAFHFETIRFKFLGNGDLTINHDGDPMTVDVQRGTDNYIGGFLTAGYVY